MVQRAKSNVNVTVYPITGRQGPIVIPHRFCEECDLTIRLTRQVIEDVGDARVSLTVRPWMLWFWKPLLRGGWHAPILTVNGRVVSQGVVPARDVVRDAILGAMQRDGMQRAVGETDDTARVI